MSALGSTRRKVAAGAVAAIASVGAGFGASALAAPALPNSASTALPVNLAVSTQTPTSRQTSTPKKHRTLLQRTDHATIELKRKGAWVTFEYDRGKVYAASSSSVTLALPDGSKVTEAITATTKFKGISGSSSLRTGVRAFVVSSNGAALQIRQAPPTTPPPAA